MMPVSRSSDTEGARTPPACPSSSSTRNSAEDVVRGSAAAAPAAPAHHPLLLRTARRTMKGEVGGAGCVDRSSPRCRHCRAGEGQPRRQSSSGSTRSSVDVEASTEPRRVRHGGILGCNARPDSKETDGLRALDQSCRAPPRLGEFMDSHVYPAERSTPSSVACVRACWPPARHALPPRTKAERERDRLRRVDVRVHELTEPREELCSFGRVREVHRSPSSRSRGAP